MTKHLFIVKDVKVKNIKTKFMEVALLSVMLILNRPLSAGDINQFRVNKKGPYSCDVPINIVKLRNVCAAKISC